MCRCDAPGRGCCAVAHAGGGRCTHRRRKVDGDCEPEASQCQCAMSGTPSFASLALRATLRTSDFTFRTAAPRTMERQAVTGVATAHRGPSPRLLRTPPPSVAGVSAGAIVMPRRRLGGACPSRRRRCGPLSNFTAVINTLPHAPATDGDGAVGIARKTPLSGRPVTTSRTPSFKRLPSRASIHRPGQRCSPPLWLPFSLPVRQLPCHWWTAVVLQCPLCSPIRPRTLAIGISKRLSQSSSRVFIDSLCAVVR